MELVHPIWHKTHFKIEWIYVGVVLDLSLIIIFYGTKNALITKVKFLFFINCLERFLFLLLLTPMLLQSLLGHV